jgi:hypothetical protein
MKKLEELRVGDWVRWNSADWEVTSRTSCGDAGGSELQWELTPERGAERYLVLSRAPAVAEVWVCTAEAGIGGVECETAPDSWRAFHETDSFEQAPRRVRFGGVDFAFDGETSGRAEDDDGNTVTKLTWDYYDVLRARNLAIEIWKEDDADYYEAYDGLVVNPSAFEILPPRPGAGSRRRLKGEDAASAVIAAAFASFFIVPVLGGIVGVFDVGAEYVVAALIPAGCIFVSFACGVPGGLLASALTAAAGVGLLLVKVRGLGGSYWEYLVYGLLLGPLLTEAAARALPGVRASDKPGVAGNATLLILFVIGFAHYIQFAPRPHNPGGLLAECLLSSLPAAAVYLAYRLKGGSDEQA